MTECQACSFYDPDLAGPQFPSCGSKDVDVWAAANTNWVRNLQSKLACAQGVAQQCSGVCTDSTGKNLLANITAAYDPATAFTSLPDLPQQCLMCVDKYNQATMQEDPDAMCKNFINTYNCAKCRERQIATFKTQNSGANPTAMDMIGLMNDNCCCSVASGSSTNVGLIVGVGLAVLIVIVIMTVVFAKGGSSE